MQDLASLNKLKKQRATNKPQLPQQEPQNRAQTKFTEEGFQKLSTDVQVPKQQFSGISKLFNDVQQTKKAITQNIEDVGLVRGQYLDVAPETRSSDSTEAIEMRAHDFGSLTEEQQVAVLHGEIAKMARENSLLSDKILQLLQTIKEDKLRIQQGQVREKLQQEQITIFAQQAQEINEILGIESGDEDIKELAAPNQQTDLEDPSSQKVAKSEETENAVDSDAFQSYEREQSQRNEKMNEILKEQIGRLKKTMQEQQNDIERTTEANKLLETQNDDLKQQIKALQQQNTQILNQQQENIQIQQQKEQIIIQNSQKLKEEQDKLAILEKQLSDLQQQYQQTIAQGIEQNQQSNKKIAELQQSIQNTAKILQISEDCQVKDLAQIIDNRISALQAKEQLDKHIKADNPNDQLNILGQKIDLYQDNLYNLSKDAKSFMKKTKKLQSENGLDVHLANQLKEDVKQVQAKYYKMHEDCRQCGNHIRASLEQLCILTNDNSIENNNKNVQVDDIHSQQLISDLETQLEQQKMMFEQIEKQIKTIASDEHSDQQLNIEQVIASINQNNTDYKKQLEDKENQLQQVQNTLEETTKKLQEYSCDHMPEDTLEQRLSKLAQRISIHDKQNEQILTDTKQLQSEITQLNAQKPIDMNLFDVAESLSKIQEGHQKAHKKHRKAQRHLVQAMRHVCVIQGKEYEEQTGIGVQVEDHQTKNQLQQLKYKNETLKNLRNQFIQRIQELSSQLSIPIPKGLENLSPLFSNSDDNTDLKSAQLGSKAKQFKTKIGYFQTESAEARQFFSKKDDSDVEKHEKQLNDEEINQQLNQMLEGIVEWFEKSQEALKSTKQREIEQKEEIEKLKKEVEQLRTLHDIEHTLVIHSLAGSLGDSAPLTQVTGDAPLSPGDQIIHDNGRIAQKLQKYLGMDLGEAFQGNQSGQFGTGRKENEFLTEQKFLEVQKALDTQVSELESKNADEKEKIIYQQIQQYQHLLTGAQNKQSSRQYGGHIISGDNTFMIFTHRKDNTPSWPLSDESVQAAVNEYKVILQKTFVALRTTIIQKVHTCMQVISTTTIENSVKFQLLELLQDVVNNLQKYNFETVCNFN